MDNDPLEQRIADLETRLQSLEGRYVASLKDYGLRIIDLEVKAQSLETRLRDLDTVEKVAFAAYVETHQGAQDAILDADRVIDMDVSHRVYFNNLPSIKGQRTKS
jgi:hypothetical protein